MPDQVNSWSVDQIRCKSTYYMKIYIAHKFRELHKFFDTGPVPSQDVTLLLNSSLIGCLNVPHVITMPPPLG
jgi:hypothetical protein